MFDVDCMTTYEVLGWARKLKKDSAGRQWPEVWDIMCGAAAQLIPQLAGILTSIDPVKAEALHDPDEPDPDSVDSISRAVRLLDAIDVASLEAKTADGASSAVAVVDDLAVVLNASKTAVLGMVGIPMATYSRWRRAQSKLVTLDSQPDLWPLAQSVVAIAGRTDDDVHRWLSAEPSRTTMLRDGRHRELALLAAAPVEVPAEH